MITPSIALYTGASGGCDFYRSQQPFSILRKYRSQWKSNKFYRIYISGDIPQYNIFHTYRTHNPMMIKLFQAANDAGKITIFDLDDDVFHMPSWNQASIEYRPGIVKVRLTPAAQAHYKAPYLDVLDNIHQLINMSTFVTASTPYLANELIKHRDNLTAYVIPNCIDTDYLPTISPKKIPNTIKIGWAGGYNHDEDLKLALPAVEQILHQYPNTTFTFIGADYRNLISNSTLATNQVLHVKGSSSVHEYYQLLADEQIDIGIIPVTDELINLSKSPIKWMEYSIANIPTIASPVGPYADNIQHQKTGWLVKKNRHTEWVKAIEYFINNPIETQVYASNAQEAVLNKYTMDHVANIFIPLTEKHASLLKEDKTYNKKVLF